MSLTLQLYISILKVFVCNSRSYTLNVCQTVWDSIAHALYHAGTHAHLYTLAAVLTTTQYEKAHPCQCNRSPVWRQRMRCQIGLLLASAQNNPASEISRITVFKGVCTGVLNSVVNLHFRLLPTDAAIGAWAHHVRCVCCLPCTMNIGRHHFRGNRVQRMRAWIFIFGKGVGCKNTGTYYEGGCIQGKFHFCRNTGVVYGIEWTNSKTVLQGNILSKAEVQHRSLMLMIITWGMAAVNTMEFWPPGDHDWL